MLAGYRSHWVARLTSLLERGRGVEAVRMLRHIARARQPHDPPVRQVVSQALKDTLPAGLQTALRSAMGRSRPPWINAGWSRRHGVLRQMDRGPRGPRGQWFRHVLWRGVQRGSLPALLRYGDRNAMAHSVESRLPYLTPKLAEFLLALPDDFLVGSDATSKRVFRQAMRGIVPDPILDRKDKIGFSVPVRSWLPAIPAVLDLLRVAAQLAPIDGKCLEPYLARLRAGHELPPAPSYVMWRLATFAAWARRFEVSLD